MNKKTQVWIVGTLTAAALLSVVGVYSVTKLPEEAFVSRMRTPQMDFTEFQTFEEALASLEQKQEAFLAKDIRFTSERGEITASPFMLGAHSSTEALQEELLNFMNQATLPQKIQVILLGKTLPSPLSLDEQKLKLAFTGSGIEQGVKDATFRYEQGLKIDPEQMGYGIDTEALIEQLQSYWASGFEAPAEAQLALRTREPEIRTADLEALLPAVEAHAQRTLHFTDEYGDSWDFPIVDHVSLLIPGDEGGLKINETAFIAMVEQDLVPEIEQDPLPVVITEKEDGTYEFQGSARFGREIDKTALRTSVENALNVTLAAEEKDADTLELPIIQTEPQVTVPDSLKEKGITELVGVGYSTFKSSPSNRIKNVNRGFQQFNGVLLEQGAEFSFTSLMGPIDAANGWLPELVIKGDKTIPEYGGGLCQVSSTMYRAALYTGLPITARKNHSYAVSYYAYPYGYGLDATVYDPNPDLRFINDTPGALLIQGYTEGNDAYFVFYGTNDKRTVKMEGPISYNYHSASGTVTEYTDSLPAGVRQLEEYAHTGFDVDWYRTVVYPEGSLSSYAATASGVRENIHSSYEARPAKYLEGSPSAETPTEPTPS